MSFKTASAVAAALTLFATACTKAPDGTVALSSPSGSVVVSLDGGRLLSWKDAAGNELFFMPANPESPDGDWSHGGSSVCWPWFGRRGTDQSMIHGFARNNRFTVRDRKKIPGGESVTLGLKVSRTDNADFPYDADLELSVSMTKSLSVSMKTANTGDKAFEISEGLQTYFAVKDYGKITFQGVDAADFTAVHGMDKAFRRPVGGFGFRDDSSGMKFTMKATGNSGVVVWTPGTVEPANRNLAKDDCPKFIVIGPSSRAAEGIVTVKPGESREMTFSLEAVSCR